MNLKKNMLKKEKVLTKRQSKLLKKKWMMSNK
jgi:hypothetical protein